MARLNRYTKGFFASTSLYAGANDIKYYQKLERDDQPECLGYTLGRVFGLAQEIYDNGVSADIIKMTIKRGYNGVE